ncbi:hypothetical protein H5S09_02140 [Limosilactobacillus sp. STM2_1]|uniref:Condensation domain-containing protein n=1 Tax=Limosilactobacillus rudii TaxID=2759755 RepID=A0A7W3UJK6_9LACO|nr:condensation domain-containing protein [Limosilactobacillus rudii]MBB1078675.1 hypothetical protein [Limosilactobacillus rudii]MBB1096757.1 hypothetical protein [Limosilactobacillus rudii]MCD7135571.1 condensation domain-containing protein [Limosilactobacillus rudii]
MKYPGEPLNILHTIGLKELYPIIRISFTVKGNFDVNRFKQAIMLTEKVVPELFCKYSLTDNSFIPVTDDLEGVLFIGIDPDIDSERWDLFADPQLRIYLNHNRVTIYLSHILTDGAGGKQFLYLLAKAYNEGVVDNCQNHQDIDWLRKLLAEHPVKVDHRVDHPTQPLSLPKLADDDQQSRRTLAINLTPAEGKELIKAAHHEKVTLNDLFMAAFGQAIQRYSDANSISLACPTDMRQFIPKKGQLRIANHTSRYNISVRSKLSAPFEKLVWSIHQAMQENKDNFQCFQSVKSLIDNYDKYSLSELQQTVEDNYHVRNISYTNFGIIDDHQFHFNGCSIEDFYMLGTYRRYPMFQVAVSTYRNRITFAFAMVGTDQEERFGRAIMMTMVDLLRNYTEKFG